MASSDPRRFIGRKAACCRKCGGALHYVNRMGGIVCETCSPPSVPGESVFRLVASDGVWDDAENPFDRSALSSGGPAPVASLASPQTAPGTAGAIIATANVASRAATVKQVVDWRFLQQDEASRQFIIEDAARFGVSVSGWFDFVEGAFGPNAAELGWSSMPVGYQLGKMADELREFGFKTGATDPLTRRV